MYVLQFKSKIHRDVAYGTLLHRHRQQLHLAVAHKLESTKPSMETHNLAGINVKQQLKIVHHWILAVSEDRKSRMSRGTQFQREQANQADLKLAANAAEDLLYQCHHRGMHELKDDTEEILVRIPCPWASAQAAADSWKPPAFLLHFSRHVHPLHFFLCLLKFCVLLCKPLERASWDLEAH